MDQVARNFIRGRAGISKMRIADAMDWKHHIHSDPQILLGKPVIRGTRLSVEFILGLLAEGWTPQQLFESYPTLDATKLQAVFAFAVDCFREDVFYVPLLPNKAS